MAVDVKQVTKSLFLTFQILLSSSQNQAQSRTEKEKDDLIAVVMTTAI